MTEPVLERVQFLGIKCDSISRQVSRRLQLKSSHGEQSSENSSGSLKEAQMSAVWLKSLSEKAKQTWLDEIQFGLQMQMPKVEPSVMSTTSLQKNWDRCTGFNGEALVERRGREIQTTSVSTKSNGLLMNYGPTQIQDELSFQHGQQTRYLSWHYLRVIHSRSFGSLTVS